MIRNLNIAYALARHITCHLQAYQLLLAAEHCLRLCFSLVCRCSWVSACPAACWFRQRRANARLSCRPFCFRTAQHFQGSAFRLGRRQAERSSPVFSPAGSSADGSGAAVIGQALSIGAEQTVGMCSVLQDMENNNLLVGSACICMASWFICHARVAYALGRGMLRFLQ